jgi:hypothetical protein
MRIIDYEGDQYFKVKTELDVESEDLEQMDNQTLTLSRNDNIVSAKVGTDGPYTSNI